MKVDSVGVFADELESMMVTSEPYASVIVLCHRFDNHAPALLRETVVEPAAAGEVEHPQPLGVVDPQQPVAVIHHGVYHVGDGRVFDADVVDTFGNLAGRGTDEIDAAAAGHHCHAVRGAGKVGHLVALQLTIAESGDFACAVALRLYIIYA